MIPFTKPAKSSMELTYISEALRSSRVWGDGSFTQRAQLTLDRLTGTEATLLTSSGTASLEMSALLMGLGPGDEVIMPSFTFVSTASAFVRTGAIPVYADIEPGTLNLDPTKSSF